MTHNTQTFWHSLAVFLFGLTLLFLAGIEKLGIYIHPSSHWFVILTGILFITLSISQLFGEARESDVPDISLGTLSLLGITLLLIIIRPTPLSVETAKMRLPEGASLLVGTETERFVGRKTSEFTLIDWLAAFAQPDASFRYEGAPADISGFLLMKDGIPSVARLVISCCGADAQPVFIRFRWNGELPGENTWIRIRGAMTTSEAELMLVAKELEIIPEPKSPYAE